MVVKGYARFVGIRTGKTKANKDWCSVTLDALDDALERVQYFVPQELIDKVVNLEADVVLVEVRIYQVKDGLFGSRLLDINMVDLKGGEKK